MMIVVFYFLSAKIVAPLSLVESQSVFAIWPPTGIALSALLLFGYRVWIGIFIGALALNLTLSPFFTSIQIALTNTIGPVAAFWILSKYTNTKIFESTRSMLIFVVSIFIASFITAFGGIFALFINGFIEKDFIINAWIGWFLGDFIGFLLLTTTVIAIFTEKRNLKKLISLEFLFVISILIFSSLVLFGSITLFDTTNYPIVYFLLPPLIWISLRFGIIESVISLLTVTIISIYGTILSFGPFVRENVNESLLLLQSFNGITSITILIILTIFKEKELVRKELNTHKDNLEKIVKNRTIELENTNKKLVEVQNELKNINHHLEEDISLEQIKNKEQENKLKQTEQTLIMQSKLASMGEMIGNIAHQWRQPLSIITTSISGLDAKKEFNMDVTAEDIKRTSNTILDQADYLSKTIDDFRNFIKGDREKKIFTLTNEINSFLHLLEGSIKAHNIKVVLNLEDNIEVNGYKNELMQCFINILNNAKDAYRIPNIEKFIFISTYTKEDQVYIEFKDNAGGIPENIIDRVFEPYFTTKHQLNGTGLGLSMVYDFITNGMNGNVFVKNITYEYQGKVYTGSNFTIVLP